MEIIKEFTVGELRGEIIDSKTLHSIGNYCPNGKENSNK